MTPIRPDQTHARPALPVPNLLVFLPQWFQNWLYGRFPSRHTWNTSFHRAFREAFPKWEAFMLAQDERQRAYLRTYWLDLETAFMARRPKKIQPLDMKLRLLADVYLSDLVFNIDAPGYRLLTAYRDWEYAQPITDESNLHRRDPLRP
jgi:hypothetical protein